MESFHFLNADSGIVDVDDVLIAIVIHVLRKCCGWSIRHHILGHTPPGLAYWNCPAVTIHHVSGGSTSELITAILTHPSITVRELLSGTCLWISSEMSLNVRNQSKVSSLDMRRISRLTNLNIRRNTDLEYLSSLHKQVVNQVLRTLTSLNPNPTNSLCDRSRYYPVPWKVRTSNSIELFKGELLTAGRKSIVSVKSRAIKTS